MTTRVRHCGQCGSTTHDRRSCPDPTQVERRRLNRVTREEQRLQQQQQSLNHIHRDDRKPYKIFNDNNYSVHAYWGVAGSDTIKYLSGRKYYGEYSDATIKARPKHRFVFIPTTEFSVPPEDRSYIKLSQCNYFIAGDFNLEDFEDLIIHISKEYHRPKTDLEQWKECGLKSHFLLRELERLGAKKYDNLEPILDMIQDIKLPDHSEMDKDQAGIPSAFTNVT
jgi:hypothetical protein